MFRDNLAAWKMGLMGEETLNYIGTLLKTVLILGHLAYSGEVRSFLILNNFSINWSKTIILLRKLFS